MSDAEIIHIEQLRAPVPATADLVQRIDHLNDRIDFVGATLDEIAAAVGELEAQRADDKRVIDLLSLILIPAGE